jgi:hypothetical protein
VPAPSPTLKLALCQATLGGGSSSVMVTSASLQERDGGVQLCDEVQQQFPRLKKIWADGSYRGELVEYVQHWCRFVLEIVKHPANQRGFQVQPKVIEGQYRYVLNSHIKP